MPSTKKVFEDNRVDYYYLIPHLFTVLEGEILVDFNTNRTDFKVVSFLTIYL